MQCHLKVQRSLVIFSLFPKAQKFLQTFWIFWWYYALKRMRNSKSNNFTPRNIIQKLLHNLYTDFFADWWTTNPLYVSKTQPLIWCSFHKLLPNNLMFFLVFLFRTPPIFTALCCPCPNFLIHVAAYKCKMPDSQSSMLSVFYCEQNMSLWDFQIIAFCF